MSPCQICGRKRAKRAARVSKATSKQVFDSNLFQAYHCTSDKRKTTEIWFMPGYSLIGAISVSLEGHVRVKSDSACIKQFRPVEQVRIVQAAIRCGIRKGEDRLRAEFRNLVQARRR